MKNKYIKCKVCFERMKINSDCNSFICRHCKSKYILIPRNGASETVIIFFMSFIFGLIFNSTIFELLNLVFFISYLFYIVKNPFHIRLID